MLNMTEQLKIQKNICWQKKIQNFEFEAPHTKSFNINWDFCAKTYFYISL